MFRFLNYEFFLKLYSRGRMGREFFGLVFCGNLWLSERKISIKLILSVFCVLTSEDSISVVFGGYFNDILINKEKEGEVERE